MQIFKAFSRLPDPRDGANIVYPMRDIITITFCAVVSGADGWNDVADFGVLNRSWFLQHFQIHKIPSHDTFRRVFLLLNPKNFENYFRNWVKDILYSKPDVISLDGKTSRRSGSISKGMSPVHILNAFAGGDSLVLAQSKTAAKSNEIRTIKKMLSTLDIAGLTVTIDAIGTQKEIARQIIDKKADYVLSVKGNQGKLLENITDCFKKDYLDCLNGFDKYHEEERRAHGRSEERLVRSYIVDERFREKLKLDDWRGCKSIIAVERKFLHNGQLLQKEQYYISSLEKTAVEFGKLIRGHWSIESRLHWILDITFREDDCRKRAGNSAVNFSLIRKVAYNLLSKGQAGNRGIRAKRKMAGWSRDFLLSLLK